MKIPQKTQIDHNIDLQINYNVTNITARNIRQKIIVHI